MKPVESDRLDAEERRELSSSDFGIPEERAFPMPDAAHAVSYTHLTLPTILRV